jgi:hypothetical protein
MRNETQKGDYMDSGNKHTWRKHDTRVIQLVQTALPDCKHKRATKACTTGRNYL